MGAIPSGSLGPHWFAEVGNGKQTYSVETNVTPANVLAEHTGKSTNIGLLARPAAIAGLQAGFDWYQASLVPVVSLLPGYGTPEFAFPDAVGYYKQNIFVGHVIYITPRFELMVEDAEIRDLPRGSRLPLYATGGYAQVCKAFRNYRPYLRYEWLNPNFSDPNNAWVGRWVGPDAGLRVDGTPLSPSKWSIRTMTGRISAPTPLARKSYRFSTRRFTSWECRLPTPSERAPRSMGLSVAAKEPPTVFQGPLHEERMGRTSSSILRRPPKRSS
jgi:hypothetical protein